MTDILISNKIWTTIVYIKFLLLLVQTKEQDVIAIHRKMNNG